MALFPWHISICKRLHHTASSKSNVHAQHRLGVWPWFARINWKKLAYHSIISICATSLCKGEKRAGPKSDSTFAGTGANGRDRGVRSVSNKRRAERVMLSPIKGFSAGLETWKWPDHLALRQEPSPLDLLTCVRLCVCYRGTGCMQRL